MKLKRIIVAAMFAAVNIVVIMAQDMPGQMPPIPVDQEVRIGKLDNGLTYYIRHNEYPANVANFYIAQRVGSINEDDNQRGLAHFLEHMAFNGSEHFAGNGIIDYTRTLGVQFGRNLNAYTSTDETVYNINDVPMTRQTALDSCLLILKDWSNGLLLEADEIDKERGVIHEEWRLRSSAGQRMFERSLPALYPGSKYGQRMPIGLMEIIDNFEPQALRDYYHKWYRPDNQAIIVVGAVDVDYVEQKIIELFSATVVPADAAQVIDEPVPDNEEAIYVVDHDPEMPYSEINIFIKSDVMPREMKGTVAYLLQKYIESVTTSMLNARFEEMAQEADCPFLGAASYYGKYIMSRTKDALTVECAAKDGQDLQALETMYKEVRRMSLYGFTATEYERARADYLSNLEKAYTNREKTENNTYGRLYCRNYIDNEPIPSIADKYQMMQMIVPNLPVEMINMVVQQSVADTDNNLVVADFTKEEEGKTYVTPEEMSLAIANARAADIEAFVDNVKDEPLISVLPPQGSVVSETTNEALGYKELTLSNGARVILKQTDFKDDEVQMSAYAPGGQSLYGEEDFSNLKVMDFAVEYSGLGNFNHTELGKALAGKVVGVGAEFGNTQTALKGQSTPKDLETMLQLIHLYFTSISKDEASYTNIMNNIRMALKQKELSPESAFSDSLNVTQQCHDLRLWPLTENDVDRADYDRILQIAAELLDNAGAFTFIFCGNFDEASLREWICTYIASLPGTGEMRQAKDVANYARGEVTNSFTRAMETPKAMVVDSWYNDAPYTLENDILADAAGQVLSMYYLKTIREDAGAAYSVGASGSAHRVLDRQQVFLQAYCPMDPDKAELAISLLHKGIADAAEQTDAENLQKVKEYMLKQADEDARKNGHWLNVIEQYLKYGVDLQTGYKTAVNDMTPEKVSAFIKNTLLKDGNRVEIIMMPE